MSRKKKTMEPKLKNINVQPKPERPKFGTALLQLLEPTLETFRTNPRTEKYFGGIQEVVRMFGDDFLPIPRPSGREDEIAAHLAEKAKGLGWHAEVDTYKNVGILVPATPGYENVGVIMGHFHTDMVPAAGKNAKTDPKTDPIEPTVTELDGKQWIQAKDNTTLGADNGAGAAAVWQAVKDLCEERDSNGNLFPHGPILLLGTSREETGLEGLVDLLQQNTFGSPVTQALSNVSFILNSDGEQMDRLTVGAMGGDRLLIQLPVEYETVPDGYEMVAIKLDGFRGGHSGVNAANPAAIAALSELISSLDCSNVRVVNLGTRNEANNALSEDAYITFAAPKDQHEALLKAAVENGKVLQQKYSDDHFTVSFDVPPNGNTKALDHDSSQKTLDLLRGLGSLQGVAKSSEMFGEDLFERAMNIGKMSIENGVVEFAGYSRVRFHEEFGGYDAQIADLLERTGAQKIPGAHVRIWEFNPSFMKVYDRLLSQYNTLFGEEARLEYTPGGTEVSLFDKEYPDVLKISNGATILDAHKAGERMLAKSLPILYIWNRAILATWRDELIKEDRANTTRRQSA